MLLARINEKKTELENLKQLRDLSAGLAAQMQTLEDKLSTLSDGTQGQSKLADKLFGDVALSMTIQPWLLFSPTGIPSSRRSIWPQVRYNIRDLAQAYLMCDPIVKIPKPKISEGGEATEITPENTLPQTLVRIPVEPEPSLLHPQNDLGKEM